MNRASPLIVLALCLGLWGCEQDRTEQLDAALETLRQRPVGHLDALPEQPVYQPLRYDAHERRSPFAAAPGMVAAAPVEATPSGSVRPDPGRVREPLEGYALSALRLVGTLSVDGRTIALIRTPEGRVVRLQHRQHIGENSGRVTRIGSDHIEITELAPDGSGGFSEVSRTLTLGATS
ncbi:pilus assembly protein PilP [Kushneria indalinina]|uniref:Type IV pilus assembly protein PilP n=1 Tax=Kushneria indalinina DSM 14324 TaxID=1122140 RepID=A0A3D9DU07_9GAMM|nr:pilus assembly protein PilP [Kushneria indalinina]REC94125.1 type IV pilus assembly protein PilP [Kushneria indalinina DSM 14324]